MYVAAIFGSKELNLESSQLIITILIIQLIAILGAWFFSKVSMRKGNKWALLCLISVWIFICIAAYFTTTANQFFALAAAVGLVMGGIQSLSRSTFSKIIGDTKDTASFFSLFDVLEKGGIVLGTLLFGLIDQITGSMRLSILVFIFFFALGLLLLLRLKVKFTTN
jgi:UMF1 family MFS transporter